MSGPAWLFADLPADWIVHRDEDLIVLDKPAGVPCQAADPEAPDDLVTRLKRALAAERGVSPEAVYVGVHQRLDRDTSGLLLYTLRPEANAPVARQLEGRTLDKRYLAVIAEGALPARAQTLEDDLAGGRGGRQRVVRAGARGARHAVTRVEPGRRVGTRRLLELSPRTGRTHQLRVQLAARGAPIAGDRLYGGPAAARLMLHAAGLSLQHPAGGELRISSPMPQELSDFLEHGDRDVLDDPEALRRALSRAANARYGLGRARDDARPTTAFRLFHRGAEGSDAFAVDVYDRWLLAHLYDEPVDATREARLLDALDALGFEGVYLKRHPRQASGLSGKPEEKVAPTGPLRGRAAPESLVIHEHGLPLAVRLGDGLRTGLFLDQRDNRRRVAERSAGRSVLNLFAYTGAFSAAALAAGARRAVCVDASARALSRGRDNVALVGASDRHESVAGDVFDVLSRLARRGERFDLVVCDPPSYSTTRARRFQAARDYPELLAACLAVTAEAGQLLCCINHHGVTAPAFRRLLRAGLSRAGRAAGLKDLPVQRDFPPADPESPASKACWVTLR